MTLPSYPVRLKNEERPHFGSREGTSTTEAPREDASGGVADPPHPRDKDASPVVAKEIREVRHAWNERPIA
jgi:hypothetical protein